MASSNLLQIKKGRRKIIICGTYSGHWRRVGRV
jgi:hypothetical protein